MLSPTAIDAEFQVFTFVILIEEAADDGVVELFLGFEEVVQI